MKENATIYKGVPMTGNRTEQMIDIIIEKRDSMKTNEIAKLVGFKDFRPVNTIIRCLNKEFGTAKPKAPKKPKIEIKLAKNTFTNYYGSGKENARDIIAKFIMETKRQSSNVLTLPADTWIMEKNILKQKPGYNFTAVERDHETYKQMIRNLSLPVNEILLDAVIGTANKSIAEQVANDKEDTYSSAILDYCGFIDSFYNEINDIMKRNLVKKGGYLTITLSENDRALNNSKQLDNYSNTYIKNCVAGEEVNGAKVTTELINFLVFSNKGYKIVKKFPYRDKKVNMLLFVIERIDE